MIKALLVDDEPKALKALRLLIRKHCPEVEILAETHNITNAYKQIIELSPELIFLDISMPGGSGLELLERIQGQNIEVIFTTAYQEYAIKALRLSALDYLLKPISHDELKKAVSRFVSQKFKYDYSLVSEILSSEKLRRIAIHTHGGVQIVNVADIRYLKSDKNYSVFYLVEQNVVASKALGEFEKLLHGHGFVRIHRSTLININHVREYRKGKEPKVLLEDGTELEVSRGRRDELLHLLTD